MQSRLQRSVRAKRNRRFRPISVAVTDPAPFPVLEGGVRTLESGQRDALTEITHTLRALPPEQAHTLARLVSEMARDGYLARAREYEIPVVKILAEVLNGWEASGVYEFAKAWTSTLIARQDDFEWDGANEREKEIHRRRIRAEMSRRGL